MMSSSMSRLVRVIGLREFLVIVAIRGCFEGIVRIWVWQAWPYWLTAHGGIGSRRRTLLYMMVVVPWGFRSLMTVLLGPLRRWRIGRAFYLGIVQIAMVSGAFVMGSENPRRLPAEAAAASSLTFELSRMSHVVVQDGIINEIVRKHPNDSASIASLFVLLKNGFTLLSLPLMGFVLSEYDISVSYSCLVFLAILILLLVSWNLRDDDHFDKESCEYRDPASAVEMASSSEFEEEEATPPTASSVDDDKAPPPQPINHSRLVYAGSFCAAGSLLTLFFPLMKVEPKTALFVALFLALGSSALTASALGSKIALINFYVVAMRMCAFDVNAARFCFFTDDADAFPEGPHLRPFFWTTVLSYVANACTFFGVLLYKRFFSDWQFTSFFKFTAVLALVGQIAALPVLLRIFKNSPTLDAGSVLLEEAFNMVVEHMNEVPWYMLIARHSANGTDFHVMGLCGAARHLADPVQFYGGILLLSFFDINPDGSHKDADQLPRYWKVHVARACLAFIPAFFCVSWMIPRGTPGARQTRKADAVDQSSPHRNKEREAQLAQEDW